MSKVDVREARDGSRMLQSPVRGIVCDTRSTVSGVEEIEGAYKPSDSCLVDQRALDQAGVKALHVV